MNGTQGWHTHLRGGKTVNRVFAVVLLLSAFGQHARAESAPFQRVWAHASETSAVVYWQLDDIAKQAQSHVEYGRTKVLDKRSLMTREARYSHFHRLTDLAAGTTYHYRMVVTDTATSSEARSDIHTFATQMAVSAIRIPEQVSGPPFVLDRKGASYILTKDIVSAGTAFVITAANVSLDLDGHTVTFGQDTDEQVRGIWVKNDGMAKVSNGHIVQGARCKDYSAAIGSRWRDQPTEVFGISTDVHLKCAYPIKFLGAAKDVHIHHNKLDSCVTEIESRHYPGNALLQLDVRGGNIHVHDNLLTGGCHIGIRLSGEGKGVEVDHNDIRHHQQYVNGYAIAASCAGSHIHHNQVTSCGRGVHLTRPDIRLHDNYFDLYGHQQLSDMPQGTRPWKHRLVELHGIKFEGRQVTNCVVRDNFVRIIQRLPHDSGGIGLPRDKVDSGVYVQSQASSISPAKLVDESQHWEPDRWQGYFVKYSPELPPVQVEGNDATTLSAAFEADLASDYTIYMKWQYVPATPLNIACYNPNARNEVHGNTFVALTEYAHTRHGGYGDSGTWASSIHFVGMNRGDAAGNESILIRNNEFISNDLFVSASAPVDMAVRIEQNRFMLAATPSATEGRTDFRNIGGTLEEGIQHGRNVFGVLDK